MSSLLLCRESPCFIARYFRSYYIYSAPQPHALPEQHNRPQSAIIYMLNPFITNFMRLNILDSTASTSSAVFNPSLMLLHNFCIYLRCLKYNNGIPISSAAITINSTNSSFIPNLTVPMII